MTACWVALALFLRQTSTTASSFCTRHAHHHGCAHHQLASLWLQALGAYLKRASAARQPTCAVGM